MNSGFATMSERHAFGLEALAEMTGNLVQAAYRRAIEPVDPEDQDRAILLFDRLSRGFRLTLSLEARLDRDRRRDLAALGSDTEAPARRLDARQPDTRQPGAEGLPRAPREDDTERDVDVEICDLPGHLSALRRVVSDHADILDPDGDNLATLDRWGERWDDLWGDTLHAGSPGQTPPKRPVRLMRQTSAPPSPWQARERRASG